MPALPDLAAPASLLAPILAHKREEVAVAKKSRPEAELRAQCAALPPARNFTAALAAKATTGNLALIAECKRKSPSGGLLDVDYDPANRAVAYAAAGAAGLSVLTDKQFFGGSPAHLIAARAASELPVLRKDFIIDPYQLFESRVMGADCILLIAAALDAGLLLELEELALELQLHVLVEVHNEAEVQTALACRSILVGVNNRNLATFATSLAITEQLAPILTAAGKFVIAESAIASGADAGRAQRAGARGILVGEALMRTETPADLVAALVKKAIPNSSPH